MKLICPSCFVAPASATEGPHEDASDMLVCTAAQAGYAALASLAGAPSRRCDYCGVQTQLDRYHLGWYGY